MQALQTRIEPDYRIVFHREWEFEQLMKDIYNGCQSADRHPTINQMFEELLSFGALIFAEMALENPAFYNLDAETINECVYRIKSYGDVESVDLLWNKTDDHFRHFLFHDLYCYLVAHQLSFFMVDDTVSLRPHWKLMNQAVVEVW